MNWSTEHRALLFSRLSFARALRTFAGLTLKTHGFLLFLLVCYKAQQPEVSDCTVVQPQVLRKPGQEFRGIQGFCIKYSSSKIGTKVVQSTTGFSQRAQASNGEPSADFRATFNSSCFLARDNWPVALRDLWGARTVADCTLQEVLGADTTLRRTEHVALNNPGSAALNRKPRNDTARCRRNLLLLPLGWQKPYVRLLVNQLRLLGLSMLNYMVN